MSGLIIFLAITALVFTMADHSPVHLATEDFVSKQKLVYELLWHPDQAETINPELYAEGKKWDIQTKNESYNSQTIVDDFLAQYKSGMLPRGEIFSVFYQKILEEAVILYRLLYSAIDFESFWKTAAWARVHINEGQFIYAFSIAVVHRLDTKYIRLPTPDEINPYNFFNSEVIRQAHIIKMKHSPGSQGSYVIMANHSHWYSRVHGDPEHKLNYFIEDIGLNAYYHTLNLEFPFWMSSDESNMTRGYRGEQYYYNLKLLLTRYNLERLANGLNEIEDIDWNEHINVGYYPLMTYQNGLAFPHRYHNSRVPSNKYNHLREIQNLETRILAVIDSGFFTDFEGKSESIYTIDGLNILGNIIEGNADSLNEKFYGSLDAVGRNIMGFNPDSLSKYKALPSTLQHYSTSLRDPGFYRLCKRIVGYFQRYKSNLVPYTSEQLGILSGLKIESVLIDKLETFFDYTESIVNNAVTARDNADASSFVIKARQPSLNHKPFTYTINIDSKEETDAMIRVFLGPKYDVFHEELDIADNYENFYEFDMWKVNLKEGKNEIKRSSHEVHFVLPNQEDKDSFYEKLKLASEAREPLTYSEHVYGFPERLLIPRGNTDGFTLKLFVHVLPCQKVDISETDSPLWGKAYVDGNPMGFPLDRPLKAINFTLENMHFKDVNIFHNQDVQNNVTVSVVVIKPNLT